MQSYKCPQLPPTLQWEGDVPPSPCTHPKLAMLPPYEKFLATALVCLQLWVQAYCGLQNAWQAGNKWRSLPCKISSNQQRSVIWSSTCWLQQSARVVYKKMEPPQSSSQDITPSTALVLNTGLNISNRPITVMPRLTSQLTVIAALQQNLVSQLKQARVSISSNFVLAVN